MSEKIMLKVSDGTEMQAYVARPAMPDPKTGLLVFQEAYGVNPHIRKVADRFAAEGYLVVAPELFHRNATPGFEIPYGTDFSAIMPYFQGVTEGTMEADSKAAYQWLEGEGVSRIGCVGYCMGGRVSFVANSVLPFKAAISYYGGRMVPALLPRAKDQQGPLLLYWGGQDKSIPPEQAKDVTDALREAGKEFVSVEFSQAGHAFNCDDRPQYNQTAADQALALTLAFFKKHLA